MVHFEQIIVWSFRTKFISKIWTARFKISVSRNSPVKLYFYVTFVKDQTELTIFTTLTIFVLIVVSIKGAEHLDILQY